MEQVFSTASWRLSHAGSCWDTARRMGCVISDMLVDECVLERSDRTNVASSHSRELQPEYVYNNSASDNNNNQEILKPVMSEGAMRG